MLNTSIESFKFNGSDRLVHKKFGLNRTAKVLVRSFDYDRRVPFYVVQVYDRADKSVRTQIHDMLVLEDLFTRELT